MEDDEGRAWLVFALAMTTAWLSGGILALAGRPAVDHLGLGLAFSATVLCGYWFPTPTPYETTSGFAIGLMHGIFAEVLAYVAVDTLLNVRWWCPEFER